MVVMVYLNSAPEVLFRLVGSKGLEGLFVSMGGIFRNYFKPVCHFSG